MSELEEKPGTPLTDWGPVMAVELAITCSVCGAKNASDRATCLQCGSNLCLTIPLHLAPLLSPTPSGIAKLLAAWNGLNSESQLLILTKLETGPWPSYLKEKILIKALDSANAYVRYLGARGLSSNADEAIRERIEQDPDPLVRYCLLENRSDLLEDADAFFALPHDARLAVVRSMISGGEKIAKVIAYAIDNQLKENKVSETELYEILCDYLEKPSFREYYNSWGDRYRYEYPLGELRDIRALWELVPKLPEAISYVLIENLPNTIVREAALPATVLKELNTRQLKKLLYRSDVGLEEFRKELFWKTAPQDFMTWTAATSHILTWTVRSSLKFLPSRRKRELRFYFTCPGHRI